MHNEGSTGDGQWLSDTEQVVWRRWVTLRTDLQAYLNRSLQEQADLSISDYEVMVMLSDAECDCLRVSELARRVGWERSRLSHHVSRMEKRGLVARATASDDARGADIRLTEAGRAALEAAAPGHVRDVRAVFFDGMAPDELAALDRLTARMMERLRPGDDLGRPVTGAGPS